MHAASGRRLAFAPPVELARVVRYVHVEQGSGGLVTVPASPYAMLTFFVAGGIGGVPAGPILGGPLTHPQPVCWLPGTTFVTVHIAPQYLPLLFGVEASAVADRAVALADTALGARAADLDVLMELDAPRAWVAAICGWLAGLLRGAGGRDAPFVVPVALLGRSTAEIAALYGVSTRQLERRYLAAYGQTIRHSRRMQRYVHAMAALLRSAPGRGQLTAIAMDAGYHDQAHMIRDFTYFTTMSPRALSGAVAGGDSRLRLYRYDEPHRAIALALP